MPAITDYADLPGTRLATLKAWAEPIPVWSSIPSGRRTTVVDSGSLTTNAINLQTALDTARAQTGGDRLVILPDNFSTRGHFTLGANADTAYDIHIVPARVVAGTYALTRYVRVPASRPSWVPLIHTQDLTTSVGYQDTLLTTTFNPATDRWRIWCVDLRISPLADTNSDAFLLVDHGQYGTATASGFPNPTLCTGRLQLSHCWTGGVAFDGAGVWRPYNLGRVILDSSTGFACNDCYNSEHGTHDNGSDQGFWDSLIAQGPVWINNLGGDSFGGIATMSGGSDVPSSFPNCADVQIEYCHIYWDPKYANGPKRGYPAPAGGVVDPNGALCPWDFKNHGEIKQALRHRWHRNVYEGYWQDGQNGVIGIKANQQQGSGRLDATDHVTIDECLVLPFDCAFGIGLIPVSADDGFSVDPIGHATVRGNYIKSQKNFIALTPHTGTTGWSIHNNGCDPDGAGPYFAPMFSDMSGARADTNAWLGLSGLWNYCRNVAFGNTYFPDCSFSIQGGIGTSGYGYGPYWTQMKTGGCTVTCEDNVMLPSAVTADYGTYTTNQHPANASLLGVTRGTNGLYQHNAGSMLLTAANGGTELAGPDLALLSSVYDAVTAGDVRSLMAAEAGTLGTADHLTITTQPSSTTVTGVAHAVQPAGNVVDASGLTITSDTSTVTASWVTETGSGVPFGTLSTLAVGGAWSFAGKGLGVSSSLGCTGHWHFADGSLTGTDSATITVTAPVVDQSNPFNIPTGLPQLWRCVKGRALRAGYRRQ